MKQAVLYEQRKIRIDEVEEPRLPLNDEALVRVLSVTLCGSDIKYFLKGSNSIKTNYPLILGHESAGIVEKVGDKVKGLRAGDLVAIEPGYWCGECEYCMEGEYNFCSKMKFMASKGFPGSLQGKIIWPEKCLWRLASNMTPLDGAMLEPLSVAYAALENIDFKHLKRLVILGAGSIGLLLCKLVQVIHPGIFCILVDKFSERLDLAKQLGVPFSDSIVVSQDNKFTLPTSNAVIDTTGSSKLIHQAFAEMKKGGQMVLIGLSQEPLDISILDLVYKGITLLGSYRYTNTYPKLIKLLTENDLKLDQLITHRFTLDNVQEAFDTATCTQGCLKVAIEL